MAEAAAARSTRDEVLGYDVLLEEILSKLNALDLKKCEDVSPLWNKVSKQVDAKRRTTINAVYPFRILRFEGEEFFPAIRSNGDYCGPYGSDLIPPLCSGTISEWLAFARPFFDIGTDEVILNLINQIRALYAKPELIILIEASNTKVVLTNYRFHLIF